MKKGLQLSMPCLLLLPGVAAAQTKSQLMAAPMAAAPSAGWDGSLPGKWTYRSYLNRAEIIVGDDPEPAVRNLAAPAGVVASFIAIKH